MSHRFLSRALFICLALFAGFLTTVSHADPVVGVSLNTPQVWRQPGDQFPDGKDRWGAPLSMELTRQAILIAARDELGLRTMDRSLGEPSAAPGITPLTLELDMISREGSKIGLLAGNKPLMDHMLKTDWFVHPEQPRTVMRHEALSRNEALAALKKAGLQGKPNKWLASAPVPEAIQALLDQMSLVSQFRAARALHKLNRAEGESPERLWALSRVYANLGQESRWFIRCQYAVFQARSLLYAQRLWAKSPQHPLGQLSMAYAWTMASYTHNALRELGKFDAKGEAGKPWSEWAKLTRACCEYDQKTLNAIAKAGGPHASVAATWGVATHEFMGLKGLTFGAIDRAMEINPLSTRNLYSGYDAMGVGAGHWLTQAAPKHFTLVTTSQLAAIGDAPEAVKPLLPGKNDRPWTASKLVETAWAMQDLTAKGKDPGELSFAVLGTLVDEANALHILYRAKFMRRQWGVDTSAYLLEVAPTLKRHPYRPLILTFLFPSESRNRMLVDAAAMYKPTYINPVNLSTFIYHIHNHLRFAGGMTENQWWRLAKGMKWMSGSDWLCSMRWYNDEYKGKYAGNMGAYDPHHPKRIALRIQYANPRPAKIEEYVKRYGSHAIVADALAGRMQEKGDLEAALDFATLASIAAPERKTIERRARLELLLGHEDKWLKAMESILKLPDNGLDRAKINQIIAHTYMNQGRFKDALPYSEASAKSWAAWAMNTHMLNLAVLGRLDEAMAVGKNINRRYGMGYFAEQEIQAWAGKADADKLLLFYEAYYKKKHGDDPSQINWQMLYHEFELGRFQLGLDRATRRMKQGGANSRELLFGAVFAQHLGKTEIRDQFLKKLIDYKRDENGKRYRFPLLADLMKKAVDTGVVDWQAAYAWQKVHDSENQIEISCAFAIFALAIPGERDQALKLLLKTARRPDTESNINIARSILRKQGYTTKQLLPTGFYGHELPPKAN